MNRQLGLLLLAPALWSLGCGGGESEPARTPETGGGSSAQQELQSIDPAQTGSLRGTLVFAGEAPEPADLELRADAWCRNHYDSPPKDQSLVVRDGRVAHGIVYLSAGWELYSFETPEEKLILDQQGCIFAPRVVATRVGQAVTMANGDPVLHNVHTKPSENRGRNVALPTKGSKRDFRFDKAEVVVPVVCDVHPWMRAFIGVFEHPFFTVTTKKSGRD